jgi:hypothetical protein
MNIIDVAKQFATEEAFINYLEAMRWPDGVTCLKCGAKKVTRHHTAETSRQRNNRKNGAMETKRVPARFIISATCPPADINSALRLVRFFHDATWILRSGSMRSH